MSARVENYDDFMMTLTGFRAMGKANESRMKSMGGFSRHVDDDIEFKREQFKCTFINFRGSQNLQTIERVSVHW